MTAIVRKALRDVTSLLTEEQTEILRTAGLLMLPSLLSKLLGNVYLILVSTQLGAGMEIGDFNTANAIPEMLTNVLLLGVVSAVVIPLFIEAKEREGKERFHLVYNTMVTGVMALFLVFTVVVFLFSEQLLNMFTPLQEYPGNVDKVVSMMRVLMIPNFILGVSMFVTSALNVFHRILVPQLAPLLFNIGKIFAVLVILPIMNNSPWALVVGVFIGSVLHLIVQIPLARMLGISYKLQFDVRDPYIHKIVRLAIPRGAAFGAEQLGLLFGKSITSSIIFVRAAGEVTAITVFNYANSLALVIPSLFGYSFAVASFPTIAKLYTRKEFAEISDTVIKTVNQLFFLSIPFAVALIILRLPIVRLTFGLLPGTAFSREDTILVAWVLMFMGVGLLFTTAKWYLYRVFYAAKNTVTPLIISLMALAIMIVTSIMFTNLFSHNPQISLSSTDLSLENLFTRGIGEAAAGGAALGISIAALFEYMALLVFMHKQVVPLNFNKLYNSLKRKFIPTVSMTALMYFMYRTWDNLSFPIDAKPGFDGSTTLNLIILTGLTVLTSFMVYYLLCYLFQVEELKILRKFLNPVFKLGGLHIK